MTQLLSAVDCGALMNPTNGQVDTSSGTTFVDRATYTCNIGHNRVGTSSRTCLASGMWSSVQPTCKGKIKPFRELHYTIFHWTVVDCGALEDPTHGKVVILQGTTFGQSAVYSCNEGYKYALNGNARRTCTATGQWSGSTLSCDRKWLSLVAMDRIANIFLCSRGLWWSWCSSWWSCGHISRHSLYGHCRVQLCLRLQPHWMLLCSVSSNATWSCDPPFCAGKLVESS